MFGPVLECACEISVTNPNIFCLKSFECELQLPCSKCKAHILKRQAERFAFHME